MEFSASPLSMLSYKGVKSIQYCSVLVHTLFFFQSVYEHGRSLCRTDNRFGDDLAEYKITKNTRKSTRKIKTNTSKKFNDENVKEN